MTLQGKHIVITGLLLPAILRAPQARIVNLASAAASSKDPNPGYRRGYTHSSRDTDLRKRSL